jgi:hypothetical protein
MLVSHYHARAYIVFDRHASTRELRATVSYRTRKLKMQNNVTCDDYDMTVAEGKSKEYNLRNIPQEKQAASKV